MNAILAFFPKPILFGLAVVLLVLSVVNKFTIDELRQSNAVLTASVESCKKTNGQNRTVIDFYKVQNKQCIADRGADETRLANAVAAWNAEKKILEEQADAKAAQTVEVFRDPDCAQLAQINLVDSCPAYVDGLRLRADRNNRIPD